MENLDLSQALNVAQNAAAAGRQVLLDHFGRLKKVQEKDQAGLVSEADVASEKAIAAVLQKEFPGIPFLGEEGAYLAQNNTVSETSWVVDPLDGTTNYVHGFHIFNISIGLQWKGELVVGVVDVPLLNKTYYATKGGGAFVNGEPLKVSRCKSVRESLLATGFFHENEQALRQNIKIFSDLVFEARGIRRPGAAAYDLCLVAEGVFDAYWEPNLKPWDSAAGTLLVREAGGVVLNYEGDSYKLTDKTILAGNADLAKVLVERIAKMR